MDKTSRPLPDLTWRTKPKVPALSLKEVDYMRGFLTALLLFFGTPVLVFAQSDALDEVNIARAARGLPPFLEDTDLTEGARSVAAYRADHLIAGHTGNDFAFLPAGAQATASGCAAWPEHFGWGSCCTYERWRYAGAASVRGRDGKRYMHLFVR
jgi:hypothetical protein